MRTSLERSMMYEDWLRSEVADRFPSMDMEWATDRILKRLEEAEQRNVRIVAQIGLEALRRKDGV